MITQKFEEISFANEQIAGMLSCGIPLEGAILKTAESMRNSAFKNQITAFARDLSNGVPFEEAVNVRNFHVFYKKMLVIGAKTDKLPETLNAVADYYRKKAELAMRLSGLMVYPSIVLILMLAFSVAIPFMFYSQIEGMYSGTDWGIGYLAFSNISVFEILLPSIVAICSLVFLFLVLSVGSIRKYFSWRINPFRDANLSNVASMIRICLQNGLDLPDALGFISGLETGDVKNEFLKVKDDLSKGFSPADAIQQSRLFPGTFKWLVRGAGGNLVEGFRAAAETYKGRAESKIETLMYTSLPFSILLLGGLMVVQFGALLSPMFKIIDMLGR